MKPMVWLAVVMFGALFAAPSARAGRLSDFNRAVAAAMQHYRHGALYARTGNVAVAAIEIAALRAKWRIVVGLVAEKTPDVFLGDRRLAGDLRDISARIETALGALEKGDAKTATARLMPIRGLLAALRRRNGVRVFADCIGDLNAAFEVIWKYRRKPPDFTNAKALNALRAGVGAQRYWYQRCRARAPRKIGNDAEFRRLVEGSLESIERLWQAIDKKSAMLLISVLREMRSYDRLLYVRFG